MNFTRLLSLSLAAVGGLSAAQILKRRHEWEQRHNRAAICVDFDDAYAAAIRAAVPFDDLLRELARHGATHLSLPELTLHRLLASGRLAPQAPPARKRAAPRVGRWNYLRGEPELAKQLAAELAARLPYTEARASAGVLAFAGDLLALGEIGLGFEARMAQAITDSGLGIVPRPVSYPWPEKGLIELSLAQAAVFGKLVAFDGDMILGHEMHLGETLAAMEREGLSLVYFAESRHQKGDWFVAKRRAPHVVLAHRFTPAEMIPLDLHAAARHWAFLARERGVRFCYVNFFKVLHAADPLEGLRYVEHVKEALEHEGFNVTADVALPAPMPAPEKSELALAGLAPAGIAAAALSGALGLPDAAGVPLAAAAAGGAYALPYLEKPRGHLEEHYPPSYAPKLLALTAAALAPVAARRVSSAADWGAGVMMQAAAAASMAAFTSGQDYQLRIEEYRGFNLDWLLPLAWAVGRIRNSAIRVGSLISLAGLWLYCRRNRIDLLTVFDPAHAEGHTHHLSTASRLAGDAMITLGPKPARKWFGLSAVGAALGVGLANAKKTDWAAAASLAAAAGGAMGLVGFRRPERSLAVTLKEAAPSFGIGAAVGLIILLISRLLRAQEQPAAR